MALSEMASIVGKDYTANKIMPILMDLIKDENSEVKLNVCNGLIKVASVVGPDVLSPTFLSTLTSMSKEGQWRVRMAVFELIGEMSKLFAKDVFQKHLEALFMSYLNNTAASVRDMGVRKAKELADKYKGDWIITTFIPKVVETYNIDKQGYNYRMCCLQSLLQILPHLSKDQTASLVIPIFAKAMKDPIPNVRFTVAKILQKAKSMIDGGTFAS
jgi:serine/threonine-protein phosphatase 2A regulatory subunit A